MAASVKIAPFPPVDGSQPCALADPDAFFPFKGESPAAAVALCRTCPFVRPCLAYALTHDVLGVWGGTRHQERRRIRRQYGITAIPVLPLVPPTTRTSSTTTTTTDDVPEPQEAW